MQNDKKTPIQPPDDSAFSSSEAALRLIEIIKRRMIPYESDKAIDIDTILQDAGMSSIGLVGAVFEIEREFRVDIPDENINTENFRNIRSILNLLSVLRLRDVRTGY